VSKRKLSRQKLGSNNWRKTKLKLAKLHERIANIRLDFRKFFFHSPICMTGTDLNETKLL